MMGASAQGIENRINSVGKGKIIYSNGLYIYLKILNCSAFFVQ